MTSPSTLILVQKARQGDSAARSALIQRYYQDWLDKFHGDLGKTVRKLYDTDDLVQSAIADALRDLFSLRNEGVFYAWVTSIIRHKITVRRRRLAKEVPLSSSSAPGAAGPAAAQEIAHKSLEQEETYLQTLDAILALFPEHPEEMTAVVLKGLDERPIRFIAQFLDAPERTVFRRLQDG